MTATAPRIRGFAGLLLAACVLTGALGSSFTGGTGLEPPGNDNTNLAASSVTIKTQEAADNILQGQGGVRGIDVSHYNGSINWEKVRTDNVRFAMVRASYGLEVDKNFAANVQGAGAAGLKVGAYHFAKFTTRKTMRAEAAHFISQLKSVNGITYPVVLDLESNVHRKIKRSSLTTLAIEFMELVKAEGYSVMIYTNYNFFKEHLDLSELQGYNLWVANYMAEPNLGANQKMWQHTSYGSVKGISGRVDINIAYDASIRSGADTGTGTGAGAGAGAVRVDKNISQSIRGTLNSRYNAGLPDSGLKSSDMNTAIIKGLQIELNSQMDSGIPVDGNSSSRLVSELSSINWKRNSTKGNITYLLQSKLFYSGCYQKELTGVYDDYTYEALCAYQTKQGVSVTGVFDESTLRTMFSYGW